MAARDPDGQLYWNAGGFVEEEKVAGKKSGGARQDASDSNKHPQSGRIRWVGSTWIAPNGNWGVVEEPPEPPRYGDCGA